MHQWLFTIRERFTPAFAIRWEDYLVYSGFKDIVELVSLDQLLCPNLISKLLDEDWKHNVQEDFRIMFFRDLEYLKLRQPLNSSQHQILAVFESPNGAETVPAGFVYCGFDIIDSYVSISTLTNCGPIPEAFSPSRVNEFGLISNYEEAIAIRDRMRQLEPDDSHLGDCDVWSIARILPDG